MIMTLNSLTGVVFGIVPAKHKQDKTKLSNIQ